MRHNLIRKHIAYLGNSDFSKCPEFHQFLYAKVDREAYEAWAREEYPQVTFPGAVEVPKVHKSIYQRVVSPLLP